MDSVQERAMAQARVMDSAQDWVRVVDLAQEVGWGQVLEWVVGQAECKSWQQQRHRP